MAVKLAASFEAGEGDNTLYKQAGWTLGNPFTNVATYQHKSLLGNGGNWCADASGATTVKTPVFDDASGARWLHFSLYNACDTTTLKFLKDNAVQATVVFNTNAPIEIYRGGSATLLTSGGMFVGTVVHLVEIYANLANSGQIQVYLDRSLVATLDTGTGVDCQQQSTAYMDQLQFVASSDGHAYIDDLIVDDASRASSEWFGHPALRPNSDGTTWSGSGSSTLTPGGGPATHYECVDEVGTPDTTDYDEATVAGQGGVYGFTSLTWTPTDILCLKPVAYVARDGTITTYRYEITSGATTDSGTYETVAAGGAFATKTAILELDPNTGVAWVPSAVNAVHMGGSFN